MKRIAVVVDGIVVNVIGAEAVEDVNEPGALAVDDPTMSVNMGDIYYPANGIFQPASMPAPAPPFKPIAATSLRLTLLGAGIKRSMVEAAIAGIPDDVSREQAEIMWEYATEYHREHPLIAQLGAAFGLDAATIDVMWRQAESI